MRISANLLCFTIALIGALSGCATSAGYGDRSDKLEQKQATTHYSFVERDSVPCRLEELKFDCDRRAILSMVGEFKVTFSFDETVALAPGYERKPPQRSGGFETVILFGDSGDRIELQHILVVGHGQVVKHWRQVWTYQANSLWHFAGEQHFPVEQRESPAGSWTQSVFEVSDAPRYTGTGRWVHDSTNSTWTSDRGWRPLPRREYTKRDDYQVLEVENRHTITPQGWTHEQDNTKVQRVAGKEVEMVREFGFNDYRRIRGYDFSPGYTYWKETADFWAEVRSRWNARLAQGVSLNYPTDDETFIEAMFAAADAYRQHLDMGAARKTIDNWFAQAVSPAGAVTATR